MAQEDAVVRRTNLPASSAAMPWQALALDVERPTRPALRVETAGRGLLVLRQAETIVLLAEIAEDHLGVDYTLTGRLRTPTPPIRTSHAAALGSRTGSVWQARWAHHFATALAESREGPLHTGRWVISPEVTDPPRAARDRSAAQRWDHVLLRQERGWIEWSTHDGPRRILPLRPLAATYAGRVTSYRKQAREGSLPPVLLWWISGLDCYVVLDGHDRLVAAIAEDREPPLLALSRASPQQVADHTDAVMRRYTTAADVMQREAAAGTPGSAEALVAVNRHFARNLHTVETGPGTTRAWPLRGGTATWHHLARTQAPHWHPET